MRPNKKGGILAMLIAVVNLGFTDPGTWQKRISGIFEPHVTCVLADSQDTNLIYVGTRKAIYRSTDQGQSYQPIFQIQGSDKTINGLYHADERSLYAATNSGVYFSDNQGVTWQNIFNPSDPQSRQCLGVFKDKETVYVGTLNGLYHQDQAVPDWQRENGDLGDSPIYKILTDQGYYYFVTDREIFRKAKDTAVSKVILDAGLPAESDYTEIIEEDVIFPERSIRDVIVNDSVLFVATTESVSYSLDQGQSWIALPSVGLMADKITSLAVRQDNPSHGAASFGNHFPEGGFSLYAGTGDGVFQFVNNRWTPSYRGLDNNSLNALMHDNQGNLWAATDNGVFFLSHENMRLIEQQYTNIDLKQIRERFDLEPSIQEVHRLAINYAEVHPNKIAGWRRGARLRPILPSVSVGVDREATELFHWDSGGTPDRLIKGTEFLDWDVTVSWDLADLIWNPDQTSIDSRSKLMVELREDIMDQVTRLYFERRRVQIEMTAAEAVDPSTQLDQEMRLAELTALIDALTGGKFSQKIKEREISKKVSN